MIARIEEAYWSYDIDQIQRVNALIYVVYRSILENEGHNQYNMPHTGIRTRQSNDETVEDRTADLDVVRKARRALRDYNALNYLVEIQRHYLHDRLLRCLHLGRRSHQH